MSRWIYINIVLLQMLVAFSPTVYFHACCCGSEQSWFIPPADCCEDDHHSGIGNCCQESSINLHVDEWMYNTVWSGFQFIQENAKCEVSSLACFFDQQKNKVVSIKESPPLPDTKLYKSFHQWLIYDRV